MKTQQAQAFHAKFTPRTPSGERLSMTVSIEDAQKIGRGKRWSAIITDLETKKRYHVFGASCGSPSCFCDAIAHEMK